MEKLTRNMVKSIFKLRDKNAHKGNHGHALLIAGNKGKMGAAIISAKACLRAGTGLLTVHIPADERAIVQIAVPEAMTIFRNEFIHELAYFDAIGIGPGIGINEAELIATVFTNSECTMVLDADALNTLAADKKLFNKIPVQSILTPHAIEFDRLFGAHSNHNERIKTAISQAKLLDIIIVLKGPKTVIASKQKTYYNSTGNAGLAKAGSGDALTGIITALVSQGYQPFEAAQIGVYLHGLAAEFSLKKQSVESMLITDVIENLGKAFVNIYN